MLHHQRLTAALDGEFVVFLIGMRVNRPPLVHQWLPVATAMTRMLAELRAQPELGFPHAEMWGGRTSIMVQYWRSMEQLLLPVRAARPARRLALMPSRKLR